MANAIGDIIDKIKEYIEVKTEQIKLTVLGHVSKVLSNIISVSLILLLSFFLVFFLSFALAYYLNEVLDSSHLGFLIISGFYLFIIVIISILTRKGIIQRWIESLILSVSEKVDERED